MKQQFFHPVLTLHMQAEVHPDAAKAVLRSIALHHYRLLEDGFTIRTAPGPDGSYKITLYDLYVVEELSFPKYLRHLLRKLRTTVTGHVSLRNRRLEGFPGRKRFAVMNRALHGLDG